MTILIGWSFEALGGEAVELVVLGGVTDFDGTAAEFAVLDVDLPGNGEIEDHRDLFAAIRAHESVFHRRIDYDRSVLCGESWRTSFDCVPPHPRLAR
jgi:hypothetical protein